LKKQLRKSAASQSSWISCSGAVLRHLVDIEDQTPINSAVSPFIAMA